MAKDEEEKAEAGEVEKEEGEKNQCEQCGKSYVSMEGIYYCKMKHSILTGCLFGFGSALRVPKLNNHHTRKKIFVWLW